MAEFDPGPVEDPFASLAADHPGTEAYPAQDFRLEWGPIFHRGRLDGSARILVLGQDPGQHESIARRILVGEAGQRVQGFLRKLGIQRSYVMLNAFLYSVYGQAAGERHARNERIAAHRHRWLDAVFERSPIDAVVSFGHLGRTAFEHWRSTGTAAHAVTFEPLTHPTMPEASARGDATRKAEAMRKMLAQWNAALQRLDDALRARDPGRELALYGEQLRPADRAPIPSFDLPAGAPAWWSTVTPWATRQAVGRFASNDDQKEAKRATIVVTVPEAERPWHQP